MKKKLNFEWCKFREKAIQNRIFLRATERIKLTKSEKKTVESVRKNNKEAFQNIYKIQKELEKNGIDTVIFKSLDNYPDLGHDVDILINGKDFERTKQILIKKFKARQSRRSVAEAFSKKNSFSVEEPPHEVEMHPIKFSEVGENSISANQIIKNRKKIKLEGKFFYVPSPDDKFLIIVAHRLYRHMSIRFCDVYNAKKLLERGLNWDYILETSRETGMVSGLIFFIKFLSTVNMDNFPDVYLICRFPYYIKFSDFLKNYLGKLFYDIVNFKFSSFIRMVTVYPLLLSVTFLGKKKIKVW